MGLHRNRKQAEANPLSVPPWEDCSPNAEKLQSSHGGTAVLLWCVFGRTAVLRIIFYGGLGSPPCSETVLLTLFNYYTRTHMYIFY